MNDFIYLFYFDLVLGRVGVELNGLFVCLLLLFLFYLQVSGSLAQFTGARVSVQAWNNDTGSCTASEENSTTVRTPNYKILEPQIQCQESCGSLAITVTAESVWCLTRNKSGPFTACSMLLVNYLQAKEGHNSFEIVAENVLNIHSAPPKQSLYCMPFSSSVNTYSSLLPDLLPCKPCLPSCHRSCKICFFLQLPTLGLLIAYFCKSEIWLVLWGL